MKKSLKGVSAPENLQMEKAGTFADPEINTNCRRAWNRRDYITLSVFVILALLLTAVPFSNIGRETEHRLAFTYLIDNDFLQHSAIAAEIAKGIPPQNIYFSGEAFQYHWLSHVFPAFIYLASGRTFAVNDILVWVLRCYTILFVCMLFSVARAFFERAKIQSLVMFLALCAYSYNSIYIAFRPLIQSLGSQFSWVENFAHFSNASNGYLRSFIVEPHALLAASAMLAVIGILHEHSYVPKDKPASVLLGLLFGTALGIEGFIGMTMILWYCANYLYIIASGRISRSKKSDRYAEPARRWQEFLISMFVALVVVLTLFLLKIFTFKTGVLLLKPYIMIIALAPVYFLLEYGPLSILAIVGVVLYLRRRTIPNLTPVFLLGLISVGLIFFVRHFAEPNHVLIRSGKILQIPLLLFSGVCLNHYLGEKRSSQFLILLSGVLVPGLLTLAADIYSFSDIRNASNTTYVSQRDYKAARWIRDNTPLEAVVQSKPGYRSVLNPGNPFFEYSLISMFAERRMAIGDSLHAFIYHIGRQRQMERERDIEDMFATSDVGVSAKIMGTQ